MYAGIEGGGTRSTLIIVDNSGKVVAEAATSGLNYHLLGIQKTVDAVAAVIHDCWPKEYPRKPLKALGLGLSGAKDGSTQNSQFVEQLMIKHPEVAEKVYIVSDTFHTFFYVIVFGGAVIISGTGSSCFLKIGDFECRCGGNGYLIGDKGSGIWIALRAIQYIMNENSGWETPPYNSLTLRSLMHSYFGIKDDNEILHYLHVSFSKPKIAGFCSELAKKIFSEAGVLLGHHLNTVMRNAEEHGKKTDCLQVIATGSVFNSWQLLKEGFVRGTKGASKSVNTKRIEIYSVNGTIAKGLAYMAAKNAKYNFFYDFDASKSYIDTFDLQSE
uniref:N-acetyl-D-glucosamine kinase n=1 Tax=Syphacia muris TaxID=451379 RepID=A0A0N5ANW1_9BILA